MLAMALMAIAIIDVALAGAQPGTRPSDRDGNVSTNHRIALANESENETLNHGSPQYEEIHAKDIGDKDNNIPINYDHVSIIGDLDLDQREFKSISITNSLFRGNASFSGTAFSEKADFRGTSFQKSAVFYRTLFGGAADFTGCHFGGEANFSESGFNAGATFDFAAFDRNASFLTVRFDNFGSFLNATFWGDANFFLAQFNGLYANFEESHFLGTADFVGCQFCPFLSFSKARMDKDTDFHASRFGGGISLDKTVFLGTARFDRAHFCEDSLFRDIDFNSSADFRSAKFDGPSFFEGTRFYRSTLFDSAQFSAPSDFNGTKFYGDLAMNSTKISTMIFDGATFGPESRLFMAKADINRLMVKWSLIKDILVYDSSAYLSLVKNYRDLGLSEADDCYYQFRTINQDLKSWGPSKLLDFLADITCGYGVKADRPIVCSLILILISMMVLRLGDGLRHPSDMSKKTDIYDAIYYCFAIFFTIPLPDLRPVGRYRYVPVFLRAMGWTLFALLIATLGKVMIK